jgi:hypothetical protein
MAQARPATAAAPLTGRRDTPKGSLLQVISLFHNRSPLPIHTVVGILFQAGTVLVVALPPMIRWFVPVDRACRAALSLSPL